MKSQNSNKKTHKTQISGPDYFPSEKSGEKQNLQKSVTQIHTSSSSCVFLPAVAAPAAHFCPAANFATLSPQQPPRRSTARVRVPGACALTQVDSGI